MLCCLGVAASSAFASAQTPAQPDLRAAVAAEGARAFHPEIAALLDAPDAATASRAALSIGRTKSPDAVAPLVAHLAATDDGVRAMVVYALGVIADPAPVGRLESLLGDDRSGAVRYAAADALGRIVATHPEAGDSVLLADVLTAMRDDRESLVRAHAASVLDAFRSLKVADAAAAGLAVAFAKERDPGVRWHEMWAIYRGYAVKVDRDLLERALRSREELVRIEAVRAFGKRLEDPAAAALVRPLLDDPSWRVQLQARETLKALAKEPPTEHLTALPANLHLPKLDAANARNDETALARTAAASASPAPAPTAPGLDALDLSIPLLPRTAALMNGPMPGPHPRVRLRTTAGDVVVRLYPEWAPRTVANFLALVDRGYFDGNRWFRIVPDFVDQTGDPHNDGNGDAGYMIPAEENPVEQRGGIIAMGLNYEKDHAIRDSAGTQFYITLSPQLHLDRDFSVFGEVENGSAVLAHLIESDRIVRADRLPDR